MLMTLGPGGLDVRGPTADAHDAWPDVRGQAADAHDDRPVVG